MDQGFSVDTDGDVDGLLEALEEQAQEVTVLRAALARLWRAGMAVAEDWGGCGTEERTRLELALTNAMEALRAPLATGGSGE